MAASWLDLPSEIWFLIFGLLTNNPFDVVRFSATCSAFRSIESSDPKYKYRLSRPLLLIPRDADSVTCDLFSLASGPKRTYELHLPELRNKYGYGSSSGWIFTIDLNSADMVNSPQCSLLDPVNRLHVSLPPLPLDPDARCFIDPANAAVRYVKKAIILADPSKSNGFVVILIFKWDDVLSFCRPGDIVWTHLSNHGDGFDDVTSHLGKFYAITSYGKLVSWNQYDGNSAASTIIFPTEEERRNSKPVDVRYLVNSADGTQLLMLCQYNDGRFSVFKLDKEKSEFIDLERLGDDQALFLSSHCAFCVSTLGSAHFSPNYIYHSSNCYGYNKDRECFIDYAIYAYNLDDKSYKRSSWKNMIYKRTLGEGIYNRACAPCIWIMPSMSKNNINNNMKKRKRDAITVFGESKVRRGRRLCGKSKKGCFVDLENNEEMGETLMSIVLNMRAKKARKETILQLGKMCGLHIIGDEDEFLNKLVEVQILEIEKWGKGKRKDFPQFVFARV